MTSFVLDFAAFGRHAELGTHGLELWARHGRCFDIAGAFSEGFQALSESGTPTPGPLRLAVALERSPQPSSSKGTKPRPRKTLGALDNIKLMRTVTEFFASEKNLRVLLPNKTQKVPPVSEIEPACRNILASRGIFLLLLGQPFLH